MTEQPAADPRAGSRNRNARLTEPDIPTIRKLAAAGVSRRGIGKMFGVHDTTVTRIVNRQRWKHIP